MDSNFYITFFIVYFILGILIFLIYKGSTEDGDWQIIKKWERGERIAFRFGIIIFWPIYVIGIFGYYIGKIAIFIFKEFITIFD